VNSEDDPEARIRALEQPLSDQARSSELGGGQTGGDPAYLPPPTSDFSPPDYSTPAYGSQDYGTQPFGAQPYSSQQYGAQPYGTQQWGAQPYGMQPQKVSGGIPWLIFGMIAVAFIAVAGGIIVVMTKMAGVTAQDDSGVSSGGGTVDISIPAAPSVPSVEIPSMPSLPSIPAPPGAPNADPNVITGAPGQTVTFTGIDDNKTVACNDATVEINGIRNSVTITGHCAAVTVSGVENKITVDAADTIGVSGFDNVITYIAGEPQIDNAGTNTVQRG